MNLSDVVKKIPKGSVTSYKEISKILKIHPRTVGRLLNKNPNLIKTPCYRVVCSSGKICGYKLGVSKKTKLLKKEGIRVKKGKIIDFKNVFFKF